MPSGSLVARRLVIIGEVSNSCSLSVEAMISPPSVTAYTRTSEGRLFNVSENRVGVIPKKTQDSSVLLRALYWRGRRSGRSFGTVGRPLPDLNGLSSSERVY